LFQEECWGLMQDEGISGVKILLTEEMKWKQDKVSDPD
jgi:hypothetical protein